MHRNWKHWAYCQLSKALQWQIFFKALIKYESASGNSPKRHLKSFLVKTTVPSYFGKESYLSFYPASLMWFFNMTAHQHSVVSAWRTNTETAKSDNCAVYRSFFVQVAWWLQVHPQMSFTSHFIRHTLARLELLCGTWHDSSWQLLQIYRLYIHDDSLDSSHLKLLYWTEVWWLEQMWWTWSATSSHVGCGV